MSPSPQEVMYLQGKEGESFVAATGLLQGPSLNQYLNVTFCNPTDSGVRLHVVNVASQSTVLSWGRVFTQPTQNLPATRRPVATLNFAKPQVSPALFHADFSLQRLGPVETDSMMDFPFGKEQRNELPLGDLVMTPGVTMGMSMRFIQSFPGPQPLLFCSVNVWFWEERIH